jgi:hypothetical protein
MRVSKAIILVAVVGLAIAAGSRLPVKREIANYPELNERFGYRIVRVVAVGMDTTRVRLAHPEHRRLDEERQLARAHEIADLMRTANPTLADQALVVELAWTWRSDLVSRRTSVRHIVPKLASR